MYSFIGDMSYCNQIFFPFNYYSPPFSPFLWMGQSVIVFQYMYVINALKCVFFQWYLFMSIIVIFFGLFACKISPFFFPVKVHFLINRTRVKKLIEVQLLLLMAFFFEQFNDGFFLSGFIFFRVWYYFSWILNLLEYSKGCFSMALHFLRLQKFCINVALHVKLCVIFCWLQQQYTVLKTLTNFGSIQISPISNQNSYLNQVSIEQYNLLIENRQVFNQILNDSKGNKQVVYLVCVFAIWYSYELLNTIISTNFTLSLQDEILTCKISRNGHGAPLV
eukprot:TRINITY_DN17887_c2_g1_i1.p2 TRINITY_DN17887_c2_g1~~TRINITY_DN17887_c2_g1_i1.p2  ORF type:complete len:277 (-),score=-5.66 TRINITY_DN17887_c2_g1_i1:1-831(-)